jgi:hypothetical protein
MQSERNGDVQDLGNLILGNGHIHFIHLPPQYYYNRWNPRWSELWQFSISAENQLRLVQVAECNNQCNPWLPGGNQAFQETINNQKVCNWIGNYPFDLLAPAVPLAQMTMIPASGTKIHVSVYSERLLLGVLKDNSTSNS